MERRRRRGGRGWRCRRGVADDVDEELEAQIAVVGDAGEEPAPPGLVQRDDVVAVAGGLLLDRVALQVAVPERLAVHLRHRLLAIAVVKH